MVFGGKISREGAQDWAVRFQSDWTEESQKEFFLHQFRRIDAVGRRHITRASAEGYPSGITHWRIHEREHALGHALSREEALTKPLAD